MELLGQRIKKRRATLGWTQGNLAREVKCERPHITAIERLRNLPSDPLARRLAQALGEEDPESYVAASRIERIVVREEDRSSNNMELASLSYMAYFLHRAEKILKYQGFSAVSLILTAHEQFVELVNRGLSLHIILAEPNLRNSYVRAVEGGSIRCIPHRVTERDYLVMRMQQQEAKCWNALQYLRLVHCNQTAGVLDLRLDPEYAPQRLIMVDEEFCLERSGRRQGDEWSDVSLITRSTDRDRFVACQQGLLEAWERSVPINWDQYRFDRLKPFSIEEIEDFVEKEEEVSSAEGKRQNDQPVIDEKSDPSAGR